MTDAARARGEVRPDGADTPRDPALLRFEDHGAQWFRGAAGGDLAALRGVLGQMPPDRAGVRIRGIAAIRPFLGPDGSVGSIAAGVLGRGCRPVRAVLFNKTAIANWSLAWHQDRTVCVRRRLEVEGFGPWTTKGGMQHVAPPFEVIERMVTLRVHLDDVPPGNAPLLIAPGSHRHGRVPVAAIGEVVGRCGTRACVAGAGDVWLYATAILHASDAATEPARRRVLQVDFATGDLPGGLEWLGV